MRGWPAAVITAILGVALAVATLVKMIEDNEFQTIWAWIGLALALAIMLVALIRVRYRWGIRGRDRPDQDAPPAQPAGPSRRRSARERRASRRSSVSRYPSRTTYGGDQVSTWSVLRSSSEPRSPVGLVKQPAHKASAKHDLALAA